MLYEKASTMSLSTTSDTILLTPRSHLKKRSLVDCFDVVSDNLTYLSSFDNTCTWEEDDSDCSSCESESTQEAELMSLIESFYSPRLNSEPDRKRAKRDHTHPKELLLEMGAQQKTKFYSFRDLPADSSFFTPLTPEQVDNYSPELVRAVRDSNLAHLQQLPTTKLFAGNKFGETILHSACRRTHAYPIVSYLLQHNHPIRVCCDAGRTVLHDAAWSHRPDWAVMDVLLDACPDLLYITDDRGCTALDYVPPAQHAAWCTYLRERRGWEGVRPRLLVGADVVGE